jgi:membrane protease YdiL (CAAX protease family)
VGPLVAAVLLTYLARNKHERKDFWCRAVDFKRIGAKWYAVILLVVPVLTGIGILADVILGGKGGEWSADAPSFSEPLTLLSFPLFVLIFGPIPEELGWRGYALDRLQAKWSALISSLLLGSIWALWHVPLFFIEGTYQNDLGLFSLSFWLFFAALIPQSILMTWIYNNNNRSTLSAVLVHFMINFVGELVDLTRLAELYYVVSWIAAAMVVTLLWGAKSLTRET